MIDVGKSQAALAMLPTFDKQLKECSLEDKRIIEIQRDLHHARAARGYQIPKQIVDIDDANSKDVCLDLQQALVTPKLTSGVCYYKRKVSDLVYLVYFNLKICNNL